MKQIISAKLKLMTTPEQHRALRQTQLAYRDGLNAVSQYAFAHGKTSSVTKLHKGMYPELRARYRLPSQLACSVERQVAATYKGLWTKLLKNREHRRKKGTRGTKRRMKRIGLRERRLKMQASHQIATQIIHEHPQALIGLEHLTDIRERTRRRKRKRKKNGKGYERVSPKARKANRVYSQWSFAELHTLISYKAALSGSLAVKVDANYTSKGCPRCGHIADENRPRKGLRFVCQQCRYTLHADLIGARNVVMRTLVLRQDWRMTGLLSMAPDASDREAKAHACEGMLSCGGVQR